LAVTLQQLCVDLSCSDFAAILKLAKHCKAIAQQFCNDFTAILQQLVSDCKAISQQFHLSLPIPTSISFFTSLSKNAQSGAHGKE
jgi:hypothetical protein